MAKDFPLVRTSQYLNEATRWLLALNRGENVSVIFFPKTDRFWRLQQLLENKDFMRERLGRSAKYMFQIIDFSMSAIEDQGDIRDHLARQLNLANQGATPKTFDEWVHSLKAQNIRLVLILPEAEKYLTESYQNALSLLTYVVTPYAPYVLVLSFYETDIRHPQFQSVLPNSTHLLEHVYQFPLYDEIDTLHFIQYLVKKWNLKLTNKKIEHILMACGGHFWLTKEALRETASSGSWSKDSEGMAYRLRTLYSLMLPSEQSVSEKIIQPESALTADETHSEAFLQSIRFLTKKRDFTAGLFRDFLRTHTGPQSEITFEGSRVLLNKVSLERFFSKKEYRVFKFLFEKRGTLVTRDEIAFCIWPVATQQNYSDWAIDQLVARVRKRIASLSLSSVALRAVRGKGYILEVRK